MKTLARPADRAQMLRRLRAVRPDSPARWGRMSAHQMVCHLGDGFRMAAGQRSVRHVGGLLAHSILKWAVLYLPVPWPTGLGTSAELDQVAGGGTPPDHFAADVARLETLVAWVTAPGVRIPWQPHPLFGPMSDAAWLRWGWRHMDHHLRQFGA